MTADKFLKREARALATQAGISYTAARRIVGDTEAAQAEPDPLLPPMRARGHLRRFQPPTFGLLRLDALRDHQFGLGSPRRHGVLRPRVRLLPAAAI